MDPFFGKNALIETWVWKNAQGVLTGTDAVLLAGPSTGAYVVEKINFCEKSGNATTYTLRLVPAGGADDDTNDYRKLFPLAANDFDEVTGPIILGGGDVLRGLASVTARVVYTIFYRAYR